MADGGDSTITDADIANNLSGGGVIEDTRNRVGGNFQIVLLILILSSFFWFEFQTRPVMNFNNETKQVLYNGDPTQMVPNRSIEFKEAAVAAGLVLLFVFLWGKDAGDRPLTFEQSQQRMYDFVDRWRRKKNGDVIEELKGEIYVGAAKERSIYDNQRVQHLVEHIMGVTIFSEMGAKYFVGGVRPVRIGRDMRKGYISRFLPRAIEFDETDTCWGCGGEYTDKEYVMAPDVMARARFEAAMHKARKG